MQSEPTIPSVTLGAIQDHFHELIRKRAEEFRAQRQVTLPLLAPALWEEREKPLRGWFPVSGMYGGFSYRGEGSGADATLIVESWSRVVGGSGQRHEISAAGVTLLAKGFV